MLFDINASLFCRQLRNTSLDEVSQDLTSHVGEILGEIGFTTKDQEMREILRVAQNDEVANGSFWIGTNLFSLSDILGVGLEH